MVAKDRSDRGVGGDNTHPAPIQGDLKMGGVLIELKNEAGVIVDRAHLVEEHRHPLLPAAVSSTVRELIIKNLSIWRSVEIKVL